MKLSKENYINIIIVAIVGFVIFNVLPFDKIFEFMAKSTWNYVMVVLVAAIISIPGFVYLKKILNKIEKNKWDK